MNSAPSFGSPSSSDSSAALANCPAPLLRSGFVGGNGEGEDGGFGAGEEGDSEGEGEDKITVLTYVANKIPI